MTPWQPIDLRAVLAGEGPPPATVGLARDDGQRLFYPGRVNGLYGESESGKSWLAFASAADELGAGRMVVILDWEDSADGVVERLRSLGCTDRDLLRGLTYINPEGTLTPDIQAQLEPYMRAASLVIIDATTEALAAEGKQSRSDIDVAEWLTKLPRWAASFGPAVLLIDHVAKDSTGGGPTGSQHKRAGITGAAYTVAPIAPMARGRKGRSRIYVSKDRLGHVRAAAVRSKLGDWWADMVHDATPPSGAVWITLYTPVPKSDREIEREKLDVEEKAVLDRMPLVVDTIRSAVVPLTKDQLTAAVAGKHTYTRSALARLVAEGQVVQIKQGASTVLYLADTPTEPEDLP